MSYTAYLTIPVRTIDGIELRNVVTSIKSPIDIKHYFQLAPGEVVKRALDGSVIPFVVLED